MSETLICVVKINTSWEDYSSVWTVSFELYMPPGKPRMVRMEGHWCLQYCQLADKGWPCLISLAHHGNFWMIKIFIVLPSAESLPDLTAERRNLTPCVCVCVYAACLRHHVLFASVCALMHVCTVHGPSPLLHGAQHKHSASIQCAHLLSLTYHLLPHVVLLCVLFVAKLKG